MIELPKNITATCKHEEEIEHIIYANMLGS